MVPTRRWQSCSTLTNAHWHVTKKPAFAYTVSAVSRGKDEASGDLMHRGTMEWRWVLFRSEDPTWNTRWSSFSDSQCFSVSLHFNYHLYIEQGTRMVTFNYVTNLLLKWKVDQYFVLFWKTRLVDWHEGLFGGELAGHANSIISRKWTFGKS